MSDEVFLAEFDFPAGGTLSRMLALAGIKVPRSVRIAVTSDPESGRTGIVIADNNAEGVLARIKVIKI